MRNDSSKEKTGVENEKGDFVLITWLYLNLLRFVAYFRWLYFHNHCDEK